MLDGRSKYNEITFEDIKHINEHGNELGSKRVTGSTGTLNEVYEKYKVHFIDILKQVDKIIQKKDYAFFNYILTKLGRVSLNKVGKEHIALLHNKLDNTMLENRTKSDIYKSLSTFFNWCLKEEFIYSDSFIRGNMYYFMDEAVKRRHFTS